MDLFKAEGLEIYVNESYKLKEISFEIKEKEITLIRSHYDEAHAIISALAMINKPLKGKLYYYEDNILSFNQLDIEEWRISDIGYASYRDILFEDLSILDNILLPFRLNRIINVSNEYIEEVLDELDLFDIEDEKVKNISAFNKAKVKLARCLISKPFALLLDDITRGLNIEERDLLEDALSHINNYFQVTIIHGTNYYGKSIRASSIIDIEDGKIKNV